ncbi:Helicase conserved domain-containing protein isoform 2 [Cladophialophora immunda]|nr:Helicase conserved domain-containing protein isoform 2 [Cladophialophora immunda]
MVDQTFQSAEQWLAQVAVMRKAIADLKLPSLNDASQMYGADLDLDEDLSEDIEDDIWDAESAVDESPFTDDFDDTVNGLKTPNFAADGVFDRTWLRSKCAAWARSRPGIDSTEVEHQITALLASDSSDNELQMSLADVIGFDDLDFVIELISHRKEVLASQTTTTRQTDGLFGTLETRQEREATLRRQDHQHKHAALAPAFDRSGPKYPHVYKSDVAATGNRLDVAGRKYTLPVGSTRHDYPKYEEYSIPASKVGALAAGQKLVNISDMDGLCQRTFKSYKSLNRMQSLLYPVAYTTAENMLICAPTGAGKTDAAMLTILQAISKNVIPNPIEEPTATEFIVMADDFKIVYVAPMKALAAEVTEKLGKRLAWLGIQVRELTGDMQLTKKEIAATQIIVTTPEKWDVVTRKSTGDTELVQKVRLLIIDEVHMLHDERGAVIESLVARTERQVESTQSLIRIVGLSATLPNYIDVADFLKVNRMSGLFYFDASFRPVPLEQHFIGVKGKGSKVQRENLDQTTFEKVKELLKQDKQVMVFVHSRKDTVLAARTLNQMAIDDGCAELFVPDPNNPAFVRAMADLKTTRGRELREIIPKGFGCHNAGMARSDRNFVERVFSEGAIKVLCCTATLAWGVNLPAAAVVIKGTQLYSAEAGKFVDLGILDVLQIFGRAGRPQFQDSGVGYICTTHDKLQHYLSAVTQQQPIESKFSQKLVDNLNAEISLGTVTTVQEAVTWLGYTYLFIRMRRNPQAYGIDWNEYQDDPQLGQRRRKLIIDAARTLHRSQMIIFNERTDELRAKDVGRIASQYYVLQSSIEIFNTMMRPHASEADVLKMISMSGEFDNIQSRDNEALELHRLRQEAVVCEIEDRKSGPKSSEEEKEQKVIENHAKTNILLQSYISRAKLEDFALVSDLAYVAQNSARICRALFMIALNRGWGYQCQVLLSMCKAIEKQIWPFQHPFHQFDLPLSVLKNLDDKAPSSNIESLREMEPAEIGNLVHNQKMGTTLTKLLDNFPTMSVEAETAPLNRDVLRMRLYLYPEFVWNDRHHGTSEAYWVWVENSETSEVYHHEYFILSRKKMHDDHELNFTIPLADPLPSQIYVRVISDRWLGAETVHPVSFQHLIRPDTESVYTDLLDLQPLPITALKNPALEELYGQRFQFFNPMQTQIFHTLYHTSNNVLLGSPTGSGKTVAAELAMWWAFRERPGSKVVYIAPMKALVRERVQDWRKRLTIPMGLRLSDRTLSEQLFAANKIQILVATSTLAWGVNLPAHLVVVKGTQFFDAKIEGYKDMDLTDVLQMLGRAGRPQFDTSGIARIFTQDSKKAFYKHFLHTGFPVESSLHKVLDNHLGAEVSAGVITTKQDALDYLTWTFFFRRLHKNPTYYGLEISAEEHKENQLAARQAAADYMITLVDKSLDDLAESDCVLVHNNGDVDSTPFGKIMSYYYLSHLTIRKFLSKARKTTSTTFADALAWISLATEFDDLPVRHNEDLINAELAKNLPLDTEGLMDNLPMWDPHVKAFLLIQAFMARIDLPISDYVGDQISVLDQGIRIIQAGVDVMTELNRFDAVVQMVKLLQCIKSARWPEDYPLSILPGVDEVFDEKLEGRVPKDLVTTAVLSTRHGVKTIDGLMNVLGIKAHHTRAAFIKAANALPDLALSATGNTDNLQLTLKRSNRLLDREARIYAPKFPKPQTEGYFVLVLPPGSAADGQGMDILALKRANWSTTKQGTQSKAIGTANVKLKIPAPELDMGRGQEEMKVDILVMSDAYPGMEWRLENVVVPVAQKETGGFKTVEVKVDENLLKKK